MAKSRSGRLWFGMVHMVHTIIMVNTQVVSAVTNELGASHFACAMQSPLGTLET